MNLLWQFHTNSKRGYDGKERDKMVMCSAATAQFYCVKYGVKYVLETNSTFFARGVHGGPAMDRFQLLSESYDEYEYILYADTDILFTAKAPNIFDEYAGADIAGLNVKHARDEEILERGWLKDVVDAVRYRNSYAHGCTLLLSRGFRRYLRENVDPMIIEQDRGKHWNTHGIETKWPVYDMSLLGYWITRSPYTLAHVDHKYMNGPFFIHEGGAKSDTTMKRFFSSYKTIHEEWMA